MELTYLEINFEKHSTYETSKYVVSYHTEDVDIENDISISQLKFTKILNQQERDEYNIAKKFIYTLKSDRRYYVLTTPQFREIKKIKANQKEN